MPCYIEDNLNPSKLHALIRDLKKLVSEDDSLSKDFKDGISNATNDEILTDTFIQAIKTNNKIANAEILLWQKCSYSLKCVVGDIIKMSFNNRKDNQKIVVIPVNNSFDTQLSLNLELDTYPLVSANTIHGQWLSKILKQIKKDELDKRIQTHLINKNVSPIGNSKSVGGKQNIYPIGTTATIQYRDTVFYLLAISEFDSKNKAHSTKELIKSSIVQLLEYYDTFGQGYSLLLPLLGTGQSRAHLTLEESCNLIVDTIQENEDLVNGNIKIIVLEETFNALNLGGK